MQIQRFSDVIAADKFAYLPVSGFLLILAWALVWLWNRNQRLRVPLVLLIAVLIGLEFRGARHYLQFWQDSESHYTYIVRLNPQAAVPHYAFGCYLQTQNRMEEALNEFQRAVEIKPKYPQAQNNLAKSYEHFNKLDEAMKHFKLAVRYVSRNKPDYQNYRIGLATIMAKKKNYTEAAKLFHEVLKDDSDNATAHSNLGVTYALMGKIDRAIAQLEEALRIDPRHTDARRNLRALKGQIK